MPKEEVLQENYEGEWRGLLIYLFMQPSPVQVGHFDDKHSE